MVANNEVIDKIKWCMECERYEHIHYDHNIEYAYLISAKMIKFSINDIKFEEMQNLPLRYSYRTL